jgi:hypothetical protein
MDATHRQVAGAEFRPVIYPRLAGSCPIHASKQVENFARYEEESEKACKEATVDLYRKEKEEG